MNFDGRRPSRRPAHHRDPCAPPSHITMGFGVAVIVPRLAVSVIAAQIDRGFKTSASQFSGYVLRLDDRSRGRIDPAHSRIVPGQID